MPWSPVVNSRAEFLTVLTYIGVEVAGFEIGGVPGVLVICRSMIIAVLGNQRAVM
jgi:hypothetical protein